MVAGRNVVHEPDILAPGEVLRILRPANQKFLFRRATSRLKKKLLEYALPVGGVGTQIGKIGGVAGMVIHRLVNCGIGTTIKRGNVARPHALLQILQRIASGIAQNQVEGG